MSHDANTSLVNHSHLEFHDLLDAFASLPQASHLFVQCMHFSTNTLRRLGGDTHYGRESVRFIPEHLNALLREARQANKD
jgi:hypothetical protein